MKLIEIFKTIREMVDELNSTNSSNDKQEILKKYPQMKSILNYTYDTFKQFGVTSANIKKKSDIVNSNYIYDDESKDSLRELLDDLYKRRITGHEAIGAVNGFTNRYKEYEDIIHNILDKDLKIRMGASNINKVYPNLIPQFKVALANKYQDYEKKVDFEEDVWYASRKLDGIRVLAVIESDNIRFYSRAGNEFTSLEKVREDILANRSIWE